MRTTLSAAMLAGLMLTSLSAHAGRPLGTDDAGTAGDRQCQLEGWAEDGDHFHGWTVSPACGIGDFELGLEYARSSESGLVAKDGAIALKWVPGQLAWGPLKFGAKAFYGRVKAEPDDWRGSEGGAFAIMTWDIAPSWTAHLNLGAARNYIDGKTNGTGNAALVWTPHERWLFFAEVLGTQRSPATQNIGLRFWVIPEKFGLDLTAGRDAGVDDSTRYTAGFGWYGIFGD
ncbi:MAG: hypothetical protein REI94_05935 [Moraxellaceae bacterium]|nr:hypothetical protein [Moraxellaceae bacterium]